MAYDNTNRGSIWKNEKKEKDTHPDFTGTYVDADGVENWVSAWKRKEGASPKAPALTFSLKPKEARPQEQGAPPRKASVEIDDEIPFAAEFR